MIHAASQPRGVDFLYWPGIPMNASPSRVPVARAARPARCSSKLSALVMTCLLAGAGTVHAGELDQEIRIDIAANTPLGQALVQWGAQAGIQIMLSTEIAAGLNAGPIHDRLSAREALSQLLQGSGLQYQVADQSVIIIPIDSTPAPPKPGTGEVPSASREQKESAPANDASLEPGSNGSQSNEPKLEEVVVSGTHIDGADPASMVITADRESIQQSGSQSMGEFIQKQPQNFAGGENANVIGAGGRTNAPSPSGAYTANIRGLGGESTLTLLDGFRLASAADSGAVDLNQIPLAAIKRVDIIPNGETAVYGADAVAGVVNVILRDDYNGLEASAALGGATEGGGRLWQYDLLGGTDWSSGHGFACFHMGQQSDIDARQRPDLAHSLEGTSLTPETRNMAALMSLKQQLTSGTNAALKGLVTLRSDHETENVSSQIPGLTAIDKPKVKQYAVMANTETTLPLSWKMKISGEVASDDAVAPETLTLFDEPHAENGGTFNNRLRSLQADFNGKLGQLPGGAAAGALGGGYREESFTFAGAPDGVLRIGHRRGIRFGFAEADLPLIAAAHKQADAPLLSLRLAGRLDRYSDFGLSANPKITLTFRPLRDLQLRASWGTSFRAPALPQKYDTPQATLETVPDPSAPDGKSIILQRFGGNDRLGPEKSATSSFDVKWTPSGWTGLSMEAAYYYIDYHARIGIPTLDTGNPLSDPNDAPFVTRYPSAGELAAIIAESAFTNRTGAPYDPNSVAALIDDRYQNIIRQLASAVDFLSSYEKEMKIGRLSLSLNAAWLDLRERTTEETPLRVLSGTVFNPPRFRARAGLAWDYAGFTAAAFFNYLGPSRDFDSTPPFGVAPWSTVDAQMGYTRPIGGFWHGVSVKLTAQNLFDRKPPFIPADPGAFPPLNFDSTNASAIGCFVVLRFTVTR